MLVGDPGLGEFFMSVSKLINLLNSQLSGKSQQLKSTSKISIRSITRLSRLKMVASKLYVNVTINLKTVVQFGRTLAHVFSSGAVLSAWPCNSASFGLAWDGMTSLTQGLFLERTQYLRQKIVDRLELPNTVREGNPIKSRSRKQKRAESPLQTEPQVTEEWINESKLKLWKIQLRT